MTEEKRGPGRPPKAKAITMRVERDYWPTEADIAAGWPVCAKNRVRAGMLVDIAADAAMDALEAGIASRVKG